MAKEDGQINIVSQGSRFEGKITSSGSLRVDGQVNGDIALSGDLVIGMSGEITGNIDAQAVTVSGKITGNLNVKNKLVLEPKARIKGDIRASKLVIDEGAVFDGKCEMSGEKKPDQKSELFR
ncbi:MAG: polymer-forming cytoskeletal protein [Bacteroidetes bacterium]|nr:polymer-forming cytoskeletal protein [Bacteroidota bacterium]MCL5033843.1 polymer-forming cytoskeletal protein [Bacteroidota bacterium]